MLRHAIGKYVLGLAAVGVLATGLSVTGADTALAAQCKGKFVTAKADGGNRKGTISKAIGAWEYVVLHRYGKYWSEWDHASSRSTWCEGYSGYWTCWAKAYPCYYAPKVYYKKKSYKGGGGGSGY